MSDNELLDKLPDTLPDDPMHWADAWLKEATAAGVRRNPNAMAIVSVGNSGQPSARMVLCKRFVPDPGYLVFYTNYGSQKAIEFDNNPKAAALFHWDSIGRQVRIEGLIVRSPTEESDTYFDSRDRGSQLGAWGSDQSKPIDSRAALVDQLRRRADALGLSLDEGEVREVEGTTPVIHRPPHWGGLRLWATAVELWVEGGDRIHDRGRWNREIVRSGKHSFTTTPWTSKRLQP